MYYQTVFRVRMCALSLKLSKPVVFMCVDYIFLILQVVILLLISSPITLLCDLFWLVLLCFDQSKNQQRHRSMGS